LKSPPIILAHGGAGRRAMTAHQHHCLADALSDGYALMRRGASALDAVEVVIRCLEGSGLFNAGTGARLQLDGVRRMDAAIMEGADLRAGAVAGIEQVRHPITAARLVMERTPHVLLAGPPATAFAGALQLQWQAPPTVADQRKARKDAHSDSRSIVKLYAKLKAARGSADKLRETVGAVALDRAGNVAAGASTGGIMVMLPGRVGDTPLVGSGLYADNAGGAVSMTGLGEGIIRVAAAKAIVERLVRRDSPATAAGAVLRTLVQRISGSAGALVLGMDGRYAIRHTTSHMSAGYWNGRSKPVVRDRFP
jgi:beta-aspartyl-peptidase (threonine type)